MRYFHFSRPPLLRGKSSCSLPRAFLSHNYSLTFQMRLRIFLLLGRLLFFYILVSVPFTCSSSSNGSTQKTLAMIKPDGMSGNYTNTIKDVILESGFGIVKESIVQLDEDTAASFYAEHSTRSFFSSLIKYITSGPVLVMVLEKENAVADWRDLIGPTDAHKAKVTHPHSIRAMCGLDLEKNCVHGSDSTQSAQREISFFFEQIATLFGN